MSGLLYAALLQLRPVGPRSPAVPTGYHAYGLVLHLIAAADPALARSLHADSPRKPLTVSALLPPARTLQIGTPPAHDVPPQAIRVTLLQEEVFSALARGVLDHPPERPVLLGGEPFLLQGLVTQAAPSPQAGISSFGDLAAQPEPSDRLTLRFLSPAVFRSRENRNVLFPEPGLVFGGLLDKWNAFCPPGLGLGLDKAALGDKLRVETYRLATQPVDFGSYTETGVQGWCSYRLVMGVSVPAQGALQALAAFATFAGVGAKTTMGLGQALLSAEAEGAASPRRVRRGDRWEGQIAAARSGLPDRSKMG